MNNKGFTLIELLIVIGILSIVGILVTISLTDTLNKTNVEGCIRFVDDIEDAACIYVSLTKREEWEKDFSCNISTGCSVSLNTLSKRELIDDDKDDCTGKDIVLSETVSVKWVNGEKQCKYIKREECEKFVKDIETVACANTSSEGKIKLKDIISKIHYSEDKCNPSDKSLQTNADIEVKYINGSKTCTYKGDKYYAK